jgi:hypothetical protein
LLNFTIRPTIFAGAISSMYFCTSVRASGAAIEQFSPIDQRDRQGLIDMLERHASEVREYLAALKARPIVAERVDPKRLPPDWQALRPYSAVPVPRRIGNGRR